MAQKNKKGHAGLIIFIIVLILAWQVEQVLFLSATQPQKAAEKFLDSMKNMDFSTMESMLQSSDLPHWTMQISATLPIQISLQRSIRK